MDKFRLFTAVKVPFFNYGPQDSTVNETILIDLGHCGRTYTKIFCFITEIDYLITNQNSFKFILSLINRIHRTDDLNYEISH